MVGKAGEMNMRCNTDRGHEIELRGTKGKEGREKKTVLRCRFVGPIG